MFVIQHGDESRFDIAPEPDAAASAPTAANFLAVYQETEEEKVTWLEYVRQMLVRCTFEGTDFERDPLSDQHRLGEKDAFGSYVYCFCTNFTLKGKQTNPLFSSTAATA